MAAIVTIDDLVKSQRELSLAVNELAEGQHEILTAIAGLTANQYGFDAKLNDIGLRLDELKEYTYAGFSTMNGRFDRLEDQVDRLVAEFGSGNYQP